VRALEVGEALRRHGRALAFVAEQWEGSVRRAWQVALFAPEKALRLPEPGLTVEAAVEDGALTCTLRARALARFVTLELSGADVIFSDNFFDLPAGRTAVVRAPLPAGWTPEACRRALRVRTLADLQGRPTGARGLRFRIGLHPRFLLDRFLHRWVAE